MNDDATVECMFAVRRGSQMIQSARLIRIRTSKKHLGMAKKLIKRACNLLRLGSRFILSLHSLDSHSVDSRWIHIDEENAKQDKSRCTAMTSGEVILKCLKTQKNYIGWVR